MAKNTAALSYKLGFHDVAAAIAGTPGVTHIIEGEIGIGKSSLLKPLSQKFPDHAVVYLDCTILDLSDLFVPFVDTLNDMKVTRFAPSERFKLHEGKPVLVMLDEIGKASPSVMNALLPLLLEYRLAEHRLPEGSVVFATTNLAQEGVGDRIPAHAYNRVTRLRMRKPTPTEWLDWAVDAGVAPEVCAFVDQYPSCMQNFDDVTRTRKDGEVAADSNPYINIPGVGRKSFVTPRSLEKAGHHVATRANFDLSVLEAKLAGCIGEAAAADMRALLAVRDKLPLKSEVLRNPDTAPLPKDPLAALVWVFAALQDLSDKSVEAYCTYALRLSGETTALFAMRAVQNRVVKHSIGKSPVVAKVLTRAGDLMVGR